MTSKCVRVGGLLIDVGPRVSKAKGTKQYAGRRKRHCASAYKETASDTQLRLKLGHI